MNRIARLIAAPLIAIGLLAAPAAARAGSQVTQITSVQWMRSGTSQSVGMKDGSYLYTGGADCNGKADPLSWEEYQELRHIAEQGLTIQLFWIDGNFANRCLTGWRVFF